MASWMDLLAGAEPGEHLVQLYGQDDQHLARNASRFLADGLRRGDGVVIIATAEHTSDIARHLVEEDARAAREAGAAGRLVHRDAAETLASLLVRGRPDRYRFQAVVGGLLREVRDRSVTGRLRAFGEMVSLLWDEGRSREAEQLEDLWNTVLAEHQCSLFCAYHLDLFDAGVEAAALHPIIRSHDHVLAGTGTLLSGGRSHG